jgi:two-component system, cell cycle sensor histidine kinase and response regulator CckA
VDSKSRRPPVSSQLQRPARAAVAVPVWQSLVDLPVALAVFDRDMCYLAASQRWLHVYGLEDRVVLGRSHYELFPDLPERWKAVHQRALAGEALTGSEDCFQRADGSVQWLNWEVRPWRETSGDIGGVQIFMEDITERKQAEAALKEREFFFRESQRAARIGSYRTDFTTGVWKSSEVLDAIFGIDASYERSVSGWADLIHPDDNAMMTQYLQDDVLGEGQRFDKEYRIVRKSDGAVRWVRGLGELAFGADGAVTAMTGTIQDITERKEAVERLRTSEEKFRNLFNNAQVGMFRTRLDGSEMLDLNDHYLRIFKRTREELLGRPTEVRWANPQERAEMVRRIEADGHVTDLEFDLLNGDGEVRRCVTSLRLVPEEGILEGSIQDITDRRQAEDALRASEQEFRILAEAMPQIVWGTRPDGWNIYFNHQWVEYTGLTLEESYGHGWNTPFHPDDQQLAWDSWQRATRFDEPYAIECRLRRADGAYRWFLIRGEPLRGDNGEILKWFGTCTDIHDIKTAEESLRQSERRLRDITANMGEWVWEVDAHGVYTYSSAKGGALLGDVIGKTPFDFMPPAEAARVAPIFAGLAAAKAPIRDLEHWLVTKDGKDLCLLTNGVPILDADGNLLGYRGVDKDITDRKRAEQEQVRLDAQRQQSQKMESVGRLAGGVAHDFNNMLTVILGRTELVLLQTDVAQPIRAHLQEIEEAARRSAGLTRQLLAFARKQTVAPKVLDLNETVSGMLKMLQRLIGEDIDLRWQPKAELWPVRIDPSQVDQVLANLFVNSRDAIAGVGQITIETGHRTFTEADCSNRPEFVPGEYVMLAVSDSGCGMDRETLSHLFEPFFTTKSVGQGTGLGLATVYGIIRQNDGFIEAYSELAHGTSFRIYLPRHVGKSERADIAEPRPVAPRGHETVLLAEDEPSILAMTAEMLEQQGYTVLRAGTPGEAIRLAKEYAGEIHVLLTDVVMPAMNGRDLARNVLSLHPHVKRLFMSGYTADVIAHRGVLDDGVHFIQKPFSLDDLTAKVRAVLDQE